MVHLIAWSILLYTVWPAIISSSSSIHGVAGVLASSSSTTRTSSFIIGASSTAVERHALYYVLSTPMSCRKKRPKLLHGSSQQQQLQQRGSTIIMDEHNSSSSSNHDLASRPNSSSEGGGGASATVVSFETSSSSSSSSTTTKEGGEHYDQHPPPVYFRVTAAADAQRLTDGVELASFDPATGQRTKSVVMPWLGFGTYRLGKDQVQAAVAQALRSGYRAMDTAFIYGGETTERLVGQALQEALAANNDGVLSCRQQVFVTTKHWRKYHGYEPTLRCLQLSLRRLQLDYLDLWLMHWPGPAWTTMHRRREIVQSDPWHYAAVAHDASQMAALRAETWRAMEEAVRRGLCRAIGVSNMTVRHLKELKKTAQFWPPAVNQVEFHPLFPQTELVEYCQKEGIVLQAYASLGGQDIGKKAWTKLLGTPKPTAVVAANNNVKKHKNAESGAKKPKKATAVKPSLMNSDAVRALSDQLSETHNTQITPAQVLLRWGLEQGAALIPKTTSQERLRENAGVLRFSLTPQQVDDLRADLLATVRANNPDHVGRDVEELTRLCWRTDPLRMLDFD